MITCFGVIHIDQMNIDNIAHSPNWQEYIDIKNDINIAKKKLNIYSINNTDDARKIANYINDMEIKK